MQRRLQTKATALVPLARFQHSSGSDSPKNQKAMNSMTAAQSSDEVGMKFISAMKDRNFTEAQSHAAVFIQQQWREEYNVPAAWVLMCLVVWYWIAWTRRSVERKCAAMEAAAEKEVRETVQMVQSIAEQWKSDMLKASTEMKLMIAKNSELTGDIDRMTTALRSCQVRPSSSAS